MTVIQDALKHYQTPFYLFEEQKLIDQIKKIRNHFPDSTKLCYAMKANPFVLDMVKPHVDLLEVCSEGEFRICEKMGYPYSKLVISGVTKTKDFVDELVGSDRDIWRYTAESMYQYDLLEDAAHRFKKKINVLLRLTNGSQFGMSKDSIRAIIERVKQSDYVNLCGIHFFTGTQKTNPRRHQRELSRTLDFINEIQDAYNITIDELEYGAGLPAEYFNEDRGAATQFEDSILESFGQCLEELPFKGQVIIELGRSVVATCGTYATSIIDTKTNKGNNFALVDGGIHQLVYYGHGLALQKPNCTLYPVREESQDDEKWTVCGSLCTTSDLLAKQIPLNNPQIGDVLLFEKTGAYCMTEGHSLFLSRDFPRVIFADKNAKLTLVRDKIDCYGFNMPQGQ